MNDAANHEPTPELHFARLYKRDTPVSGPQYRVTDFADLSHQINPELFYSDEYDPVLADLIDRVLAHEAPILDALLVQRIARAHGFMRSGRLIRERVLELVEQKYHLQRNATEDLFVWLNESHRQEWAHYRAPATDNDVRSIEEIALEELKARAKTLERHKL